MKKISDLILVKEVVGPILIILFSFLLYLLLSNVVKKLFKFKSKHVNSKKQKTLCTFFINIIRYVIIIIALLMILSIYGIDTKAILASLGIVSLVLGLALQDMIKDFVSGISLVLDDTYNVGDWVTINTFKGEVISLGMKTTRIKSYSGDILVINNGSITQVINHSIANSMALVDVNVPYEENIEKVEKILTQLCKKLQQDLQHLKGNVELLGIENLAESFITFRMTVEVESLTQYEVQRQMKKQIKLELDKNGIKIPYQQVVIRNEK